MKYSVDSKSLNEAIARCITVKEGYTLTFTNSKVGGTKDVYLQITACTANAISIINISVTPLEEVQPRKVQVGIDILSAVKALVQAGSSIELDLQDSTLVLSCGDSQIPIKYKDQVTNFTPKSPKKEECASFVVDSKEWKRMIQQGGFAYGSFDSKGKQAALNNIYLLPCKDCVRIVTFSGFYATSSYAPIKEQTDEKYIDMVQAAHGVCLTPVTIKSITNELKSEVITVYLLDTQLLIKDGNDIFSMSLSDTRSMERVFGTLDEEGYFYRFKTTTEDIKVALNIVSVNCSDPNHASMLLEIKNNGVLVHSADGRNKAAIKAENIEGAATVLVSIKQLKEIIANGMTEVDSITVFGYVIGEESRVIHVNGGHCRAFTALVAPSNSTTVTDK